MDRHGAQKTKLCRAFMKHMGVVEAFIPANCTDSISPVDKHVAQKIKMLMYAKFESEKGWAEMSAEQKRRLCTYWASTVWEEFKCNRKDLCRAAFVKTGFLNAMDGSDDAKIQLVNNLKKGEVPNLLPDGTLYVVKI